MAVKPSPRQRDLLRYAAQMGGSVGQLGSDPRTVAVCIREGWLTEQPIERDFGLGPGKVLVLTDAGRALLSS